MAVSCSCLHLSVCSDILDVNKESMMDGDIARRQRAVLDPVQAEALQTMQVAYSAVAVERLAGAAAELRLSDGTVQELSGAMAVRMETEGLDLLQREELLGHLQTIGNEVEAVNRLLGIGATAVESTATGQIVELVDHHRGTPQDLEVEAEPAPKAPSVEIKEQAEAMPMTLDMKKFYHKVFKGPDDGGITVPAAIKKFTDTQHEAMATWFAECFREATWRSSSPVRTERRTEAIKQVLSGKSYEEIAKLVELPIAKVKQEVHVVAMVLHNKLKREDLYNKVHQVESIKTQSVKTETQEQ
jgi:hypothetical protein